MAPAALKVPAGQVAHCCEALASLALPAEPKPTLCWNLPGAQKKLHEVASTALEAPAAQGSHEAEPADQNDPAAQMMQEDVAKDQMPPLLA